MVDESTTHLQDAERLSRPLRLERQTDERVSDTELQLRADQGKALRLTIYHCTAAIVAAIKESSS